MALRVAEFLLEPQPLVGWRHPLEGERIFPDRDSDHPYNPANGTFAAYIWRHKHGPNTYEYPWVGGRNWNASVALIRENEQGPETGKVTLQAPGSAGAGFGIPNTGANRCSIGILNPSGSRYAQQHAWEKIPTSATWLPWRLWMQTEQANLRTNVRQQQMPVPAVFPDPASWAFTAFPWAYNPLDNHTPLIGKAAPVAAHRAISRINEQMLPGFVAKPAYTYPPGYNPYTPLVPIPAPGGKPALGGNPAPPGRAPGQGNNPNVRGRVLVKPHPRPRPPGKNVKEKKSRVTKGLIAALDAFGAATEVADVIDAFWSAGLPDKYKQWSFHDGRPVKPRADKQFRQLYRHWDKINIEEGLIAVGKDMLQDEIIGRTSPRGMVGIGLNNALRQVDPLIGEIQDNSRKAKRKESRWARDPYRARDEEQQRLWRNRGSSFPYSQTRLIKDWSDF